LFDKNTRKSFVFNKMYVVLLVQPIININFCNVKKVALADTGKITIPGVTTKEGKLIVR